MFIRTMDQLEAQGRIIAISHGSHGSHGAACPWAPVRSSEGLSVPC